MSGSAEQFDGPILRLEPIAGPPLEPITIDRARTVRLGRSTQCDVRLAHESVSRLHATLLLRNGTWFITDSGSRHGLMLSGVRLEPGKPAAMGDGDLLLIGPWMLRVGIGQPSMLATMVSTTVGPERARGRVERVGTTASALLTRRRLDLLVECLEQALAAADEPALCAAVIRTALLGTGFDLGAIVRPMGSGSDVEILAAMTRETAADGSPRASFMPDLAISRSLLNEAASGEIAALVSDRTHIPSVSIAQLGITSAICVPIPLGGTIDRFLYLDSRGEQSRVEADPELFCRSLARMCSLASANLRRQQLEHRQQRLEADLDAARRAQQLLMPEPQGDLGSVRYASRMRPGLVVAGDLFDVVPIPGGRVGVVLGDVSGKGVGSSLIMAAAQSVLHDALLRTGDPGEALAHTNAFLAARTGMDRFVTVVVAVADPSDGSVRCADAGHGYVAAIAPGARPRQVRFAGGPPIGIAPEFPYPSESITVAPGERLVLFSDGLVEQPNHAGDVFGFERVLSTLAGSGGATDDVARLFAALDAFAAGEPPTDDTTVASLELFPPG